MPLTKKSIWVVFVSHCLTCQPTNQTRRTLFDMQQVCFKYLTCIVMNREFVNSVSCIKILSPQEVQQMGKLGIELLNSVQLPKPSDNGYENYTPSRQESMSLSNGVGSVGSLEY